MATFTKPTYAVDNITSLSDTPNATEGLTGAQLRAKFDKTGADGKIYVDTLADELDTFSANIEGGWIPLTGLSYASASTITTATNLTGVIGVGDKIKWTQTTVKYGYVIAITASLITIAVNTDYVVTNAPITLGYYSHESSPFGFPQWFSYLPTIANITTGNGTYDFKFNITGKIVNVMGQFTFGSTSSISGAVQPSMPITITQASIGTSYLVDANGTYKIGAVSTVAGGTSSTVFCITVSGSNTIASQLSATVPHTWADGDIIRITVSYRI